MLKTQLELVKNLWNLTDELIQQDLDISQIYLYSLDQKMAFATLEKFHKTLPETLKCPKCRKDNPRNVVEIVYQVRRGKGNYTQFRCTHCDQISYMGEVLRFNE